MQYIKEIGFSLVLILSVTAYGNIPTPPDTSDCCPPNGTGIVDEVPTNDYLGTGMPGIYGEKAPVDLGPDLCLEWKADTDNPGIMTIPIPISGGFDDDPCADFYSALIYGNGREAQKSGGNLPGSIYVQPATCNRGQLYFKAQVPCPPEYTHVDYSLTVKVLDVPYVCTWENPYAHCYARDDDKMDTINVCVSRPRATWECDYEYTLEFNATGISSSIGAAVYLPHLFKYSIDCPIDLTGRYGSEAINRTMTYTITVDGTVQYNNSSNYQPNHESGHILAAVNLVANQPIPLDPPNPDVIPWPTSCSVDPGFFDLFGLKHTDPISYLDSLSGNFREHRLVGTFVQSLYIDGTPDVYGTGLKVYGPVTKVGELTYNTVRLSNLVTNVTGSF